MLNQVFRILEWTQYVIQIRGVWIESNLWLKSSYILVWEDLSTRTSFNAGMFLGWQFHLAVVTCYVLSLHSLNLRSPLTWRVVEILNFPNSLKLSVHACSQDKVLGDWFQVKLTLSLWFRVPKKQGIWGLFLHLNHRRGMFSPPRGLTCWSLMNHKCFCLENNLCWR